MTDTLVSSDTAERLKLAYAAATHQGPHENATRRKIVVALYEKGLSIREVAKLLGITFQAVHAMLLRSGVTPRPRGGNTGSHSRHK